ncbi:hypothetical protein ACLMJK_007927 [Lecanora helva]
MPDDLEIIKEVEKLRAAKNANHELSVKGGDDTLNHEFFDGWNRRMEELYHKHMKGREHAYWSALMILPEWQGCGIGSSIIRWALEYLRLDSMPVWLNAQPDGYKLCKKFGWKDIGNVDIDLAEWAGPNKVYGIHRTVCMLRDPLAAADV